MSIRIWMLALAAAPAFAAPAMAQTYTEQQRFDAAQRRYDAETRLYQRARDAYERARARDGRQGYYQGQDQYRPDGYRADGYRADGYRADPYAQGQYAPPPPPPGYGAQGGYAPPSAQGAYATDYDASRYYRDDPRYEERVLSSNDQVYRGSDGRYYCKRNDGTTGLIVGGAAGGILGNVIDGGHNRVAGTLIGGAVGALLGKSVDQNQSQVKCR